MSLQFEPVRDLLQRGAMYGIDKESLGRSQITHARIGRASKYIPRFVYCTPHLQRVIMLRAWRFAHCDAPFPMRYERTTLDKECTARVERIAERNPACRNTARLQAAVFRCGSYMGFLARLSWMAFREQPPMHSSEIAAELGISRSQVEINLKRLVKCAAALGFPTHKFVPQGGKQRRPIDTERVLTLWCAGKTTTAIAAAIGDTDDRVRRTLKESGFVVNKSEARRRRAFPPVDVNRALALWHAGENTKMIAKSLGASVYRVRCALTESGIVITKSTAARRAWRNFATRAAKLAGQHARIASRNTVALHCD